MQKRASGRGMTDLAEKLIAPALAAGAAIMEIHATLTAEDTRAKGDGSPVTEADERAETIILAALADIAPDIPVVAEEQVAAGVVPDIGAQFWLVDPLDGTREFINGKLDFTVNIGLIENRVPVLGLVYVPATGVLYLGDRDGARMAQVTGGLVGPWQSIRVATPDPAALRVLASRSHMSDETKAFIDRFTVAELVSAGSSLKFCRLAAGEADLYPRMGRTMEWDTAAADAVLRAAGGRVMTLDGNDLLYGKRNQVDDSDFANPWFVASGPFDPFAN
jgi:3'(2'), 5'-bisphosphate nucleotidase